MASSYNLTPERKQKLKKEVMAEIDKSEMLKIKPKSQKTISLAPKNPQPRSIKIEKKPPITKNDQPKIVVPAPAEKIKSAPITPAPKPQAIKKVTKIEVKKNIVKPTPKTSTSKNKIKKKPKPAPSPIPKKSVKTIEEKNRERDLFFKLDSLVRPSISQVRMFKAKTKIGHKKIWIWSVIVGLILAMILALAVNIFGIYKLDWSGPVSQKVISILPLPAATVNGRVISLADYYQDLDIVKSVATETDAAVLTSDKTKEQLLNRLISINIIENELKQYDKVVTDDIIDSEMQKIIDQVGSVDQAVSDIQNVYGLNLADFKNNVLAPIIAVDMLNEILISDESLEINQATKKMADEALNLAMTPGTDFKTLVVQFSNDPSTLEQNGDLGWFAKGELPKDIEEALFSLSSGEVYNQVIKNESGYHIYKVETKLIDEESGRESLKLNQIFITVNTELYIKSLFDKAIIKRFI